MQKVNYLSINRIKLLKNISWENVEDLNHLESILAKKGAFSFNTASKTVQKNKITYLRAALTDMWPMGTHYWIRDNALIGCRMLEVDTYNLESTVKYRKLGKDLLLSALNIMSTKSQLTRMQKLIESNSTKFINCADNYPQIFLTIKDNLAGNKHEAWAHKQDAWQIVACQVLKYLEQGVINLKDLNTSNRKFFSLLVPLLGKIKFYKQENSGSWEELEAVRTSVIAWEVALLRQIQVMETSARFNFLVEGFNLNRHNLQFTSSAKDFSSYLAKLLIQGAETLKKNIPFECPNYNNIDARYRKADSALIYLLQLNTAKTVADILNLSDTWVHTAEDKILACIHSLYDSRTGGHKRYLNDSYQRFGFFREETVKLLTKMYGGPSGSADKNFVGRDKIVPKGPEAAWTHFTWQLSAWYGAKFSKTLNIKYLKLQKQYFADGLRSITVPGDFSFEQFGKDKVRKIKIPAYRCPECYLTEADKNGKHYVFPTPHTPLNWATAEALSAFSALRKSLVLSQK